MPYALNYFENKLLLCVSLNYMFDIQNFYVARPFTTIFAAN